MRQLKTQKPVNDALALLIVGSLAIMFPMIIVPMVIMVAIAGFVLTSAGKRNPSIPTLAGLFAQKQVVVTTRVVLLLLFGTLPLMIAKGHLWAVTVCFVYNMVIFALIIADILLSTHPDKLVVERRMPGKLSIGQANKVELVVTNHSHSPVDIELVDEFPEEFKGEGRQMRLQVAKRTSASLTYEFIPLSRGCFFFDRTVMRYRGLLELVIFQQDYGEPFRVEVYPDITSIARFDLLMRRSHLMDMGLISERRRGSGTDFESLREYVKGDEYRKIDWKASARRNKLITREFQSEVNQAVLVMIDCSRSMGARVGDISLLDHAANGALLLGHQVLKKGDMVGLVTFSDVPHQFLPPRRGKNHFFSFVRQLYAVQAGRVEPDYVAVLQALNMTSLKRSLLMIITDLTSGEAVEKMQQAIAMTSRRHLPIVISLLDPRLKEAAERVPENEAQVYQKVVARNMINRISAMAQRIEQMGVATIIVTPAQLSSSMLSQYLKVKLRSRL